MMKEEKMLNEFSRTAMLIGNTAMQKLQSSCVAVFGIGGVGSYAVEGLARAGIGKFVLVDDDYVCITNINRQIHAAHSTIGKSKVETMMSRILDINPDCKVETFQRFYLPECSNELIRPDYDYIVEAVDTVTAKIDIVVNAARLGIPVISCMGAGNKVDPTGFRVADIYETSVCPLARVMRKELRQRGITSLKVVYSREVPIEFSVQEGEDCRNSCVCPPEVVRKCISRRNIPGSISFVPSVAGLIMAGEVVKDLISVPNKIKGNVIKGN